MTIVLVGAISSAAGTAFGYAAGGVSVPDSTFRQGSGTQQVTITLGTGVVGTDQTLIVWPFYFSDYHWLVGVTADPGTGGNCAYDVGQWQCTPGRGGWHAGNLRVLVNTAKAMDCGLHAGVCQNDEINVQGLPDAPDHNGLPDGQPLSVLGNVLIMPESVPWHGATPQPVYREPLATPSAPGTAVAPGPVISIDAVSTARTGASGGSPAGRYAGLAGLVVVGAGAAFGYRTLRRRRAARGE
jgi:hypothetical protein